jgi:membrane protein
MKCLKRFRNQIIDGEIALVAGSLSFFTVLCIIPFLAVSLVIIQKIGGLESLYPKVEKLILAYFSSIIGTEDITLIKKSLKRMISGKVGGLGALFLVLTSTRLIYEMERGIHRVWNIKNERNLFQRITYYWLSILLFPFGLAIYTAILSTKEIHTFSFQIFSILFFLMLVYKIVPNIFVPWRAAIWGAIVGTVSLLITNQIFLWFSKQAFNYGKLYGSLAAIPLFLLWVLLLWYAILMGAATSASMKD